VRSVFWTRRARHDLAAIRDFISKDSAHYAEVVISGVIAAADQAAQFPESGGMVPEYENPAIREVIRPPYRIVYRLIGADTIHILTIHHGARRFPSEL